MKKGISFMSKTEKILVTASEYQNEIVNNISDKTEKGKLTSSTVLCKVISNIIKLIRDGKTLNEIVISIGYSDKLSINILGKRRVIDESVFTEIDFKLKHNIKNNHLFISGGMDSSMIDLNADDGDIELLVIRFMRNALIDYITIV